MYEDLLSEYICFGKNSNIPMYYALFIC